MTKIMIGLVGQPSSGKDTVAVYLESKGFVHRSTSDVIRQYIKEHNLGEPVRELMQKIGNLLRHENGADYLVVSAMKDCGDLFVTSGMRNPAEAQTFKKAGGYILEITAPIEVRYQRAKLRGRVGEDISLEQFKQIELQETSSSDPQAQNTAAVLAMADAKVDNNGDLEALYRQIDDVLRRLDNH